MDNLLWWNLKRLFPDRPRRLIGVFALRLPCGRCQLYRCSQLGNSDVLLDIEVDKLTWVLALIAADRLGWLQRGEPIQPEPTQMRLTVATDTPTSVAICLPV
jgi:hypothetical protein